MRYLGGIGDNAEEMQGERQRPGTVIRTRAH
jgi:hypothetical protein